MRVEVADIWLSHRLIVADLPSYFMLSASPCGDSFPAPGDQSMTRDLRRAIVSIAMVVTMALSLAVALPIAQKWTQPRAMDAAKSAKPTEIVTAVVHKALIPQLAVAFSCISLGIVVGFVVAKKLPPADTPANRPRR